MMLDSSSAHVSNAPSGSVPWRHGPSPVLGLIGGMGSGKSWLAQRLATLGAAIIDADRVGHQVLERPEIRAQLLDAFPGVSDIHAGAEGGSLGINRQALAAIVFENPCHLQTLESIVHPAMREVFQQTIEQMELQASPPPTIVLDAAILLEAGWDDLCDLIAFVDVSDEIRHRRLREARGWTDDEIRRRESNQWSLDRKRARAHHIIRDLEFPAESTQQIQELLQRLGWKLPWLPMETTPDPIRTSASSKTSS